MSRAFHAFIDNPILISRLFFILIATAIGCYIGIASTNSLAYSLTGLVLASLFVLIEHATNFVSSKSLLFAATGAFVGLIFSSLVHPVIPADFIVGLRMPHNTVPLVSHLIFAYLGVSLGLRHVGRFSFSRLNFILSTPSEAEKVIDSSILVDGRILDVIDTNILSGPFVVPTFILGELQYLADSPLAVRRNRGRRALEVLETLRERYGRVRLDETDYAEMPVDRKLLRFTAEINGVLMTNDYNLQKVAQIHQVRTINLNEIANVLKPRVYVGEQLGVYLDREGKEADQGVGYLDDGTMVIVEDGRQHIGTELIVEITSVLQTPSGRMVFARICEGALEEGGRPTDEAEQLEEVRRTRITPRDIAAIDDEAFLADKASAHRPSMAPGSDPRLQNRGGARKRAKPVRY